MPCTYVKTCSRNGLNKGKDTIFSGPLGVFVQLTFIQNFPLELDLKNISVRTQIQQSTLAFT